MADEHLPRVVSAGGDGCVESGEVVMVHRSAVAPCLTCGLCGGILRDATTVSECLHSFCRKCISKKFKDEDITCCPTCSADLGCNPLEKLSYRADHSLQCIRLMVFPVKRRKVEKISLLHPALVSLPSHLPRAHGVGQPAKKTDAFSMGDSMNAEAEKEAAESLEMECTASPTKPSMYTRSTPAEEVGTFSVTVEKERRTRATAESTLSSSVEIVVEGTAGLPPIASQRETHEAAKSSKKPTISSLAALKSPGPSTSENLSGIHYYSEADLADHITATAALENIMFRFECFAQYSIHRREKVKELQAGLERLHEEEGTKVTKYQAKVSRLSKYIEDLESRLAILQDTYNKDIKVWDQNIKRLEADLECKKANKSLQELHDQASNREGAVTQKLAHEQELQKGVDHDLVQTIRSLQTDQRVIAGLKAVKVAAENLVNMIAPEANTEAPMPILERLKEAPEQVKACIIKFVAACASHVLVLALVKSHYPSLDVAPIGDRIAADCLLSDFQRLVAEMEPAIAKVVAGLPPIASQRETHEAAKSSKKPTSSSQAALKSPGPSTSENLSGIHFDSDTDLDDHFAATFALERIMFDFECFALQADLERLHKKEGTMVTKNQALSKYIENRKSRLAILQDACNKDIEVRDQNIKRLEADLECKKANKSLQELHGQASNREGAVTQKLAHEQELQKGEDHDLVQTIRSLQTDQRVIAGLKAVEVAAENLVNMIAPEANTEAPMPILERLKEAPEQVKARIIKFVAACASHVLVLALVKSHVAPVADGIAADFQRLVAEMGPVWEHIRCKPTLPCKLWKLQSGPHDIDPRVHSGEVGGVICNTTLQITPPTFPEFCKSPLPPPLSAPLDQYHVVQIEVSIVCTEGLVCT